MHRAFQPKNGVQLRLKIPSKTVILQKIFYFFVFEKKMTHVQRTLVVLKPDSVGRSIT